MQKVFIISLFLFLAKCSTVWAQKKDSVTMRIDYFDAQTGNKYAFDKKFDHSPTRNDSTSFQKESSIAFHKMIDSINNAEALKRKNKPIKRKTTNP